MEPLERFCYIQCCGSAQFFHIRIRGSCFKHLDLDPDLDPAFFPELDADPGDPKSPDQDLYLSPDMQHRLYLLF